MDMLEKLLLPPRRLVTSAALLFPFYEHVHDYNGSSFSVKLRYIRSQLSGSFIITLSRVTELQSALKLRSSHFEDLKMSTTRSVTRWILLLTLAVVMLLSVSKGNTELLFEC